MHIARSYSISFQLLELIYMNYEWLDPLGRGNVATTLVQPDEVDMVLCCIRLRFEKSSPRWRIAGSVGAKAHHSSFNDD